MENIIDSIQRVDPIDIIEEHVGKKMTEMTDEEQIGTIGAFVRFNQLKRDILQEAQDTYFGVTWQEFNTILARNSFTRIINNPVADNDNEEGIWIKGGVVIYADSYWHCRDVNGGNMYLQIEFSDDAELEKIWKDLGYGSSYSIERYHDESNSGVVILSYDVREGLVNFLRKAEKYRICPVWKKSTHIWFISYEEAHAIDGVANWRKQSAYYESVNRRKINSDMRLKKICQVWIDAHPEESEI